MMELRFGLYPRFYARRKDLLFPLIEKYYGESVKGRTHGQTIQIYYSLLRSSPEFKEEMDGMIKQNAGSLLTVQEKKGIKDIKSGTLNATGIGMGILSTIGSIFGFAEAKVSAEAADDEAFYDIVLAEQKKDDTIKVLVVSCVALAFVGIGVYMVVKSKK